MNGLTYCGVGCSSTFSWSSLFIQLLSYLLLNRACRVQMVPSVSRCLSTTIGTLFSIVFNFFTRSCNGVNFFTFVKLTGKVARIILMSVYFEYLGSISRVERE